MVEAVAATAAGGGQQGQGQWPSVRRWQEGKTEAGSRCWTEEADRIALGRRRTTLGDVEVGQAVAESTGSPGGPEAAKNRSGRWQLVVGRWLLHGARERGETARRVRAERA